MTQTVIRYIQNQLCVSAAATMTITFRQIEVFVEAAKDNNFRKTADRLGISQPSAGRGRPRHVHRQPLRPQAPRHGADLRDPVLALRQRALRTTGQQGPLGHCHTALRVLSVGRRARTKAAAPLLDFLRRLLRREPAGGS